MTVRVAKKSLFDGEGAGGGRRARGVLEKFLEEYRKSQEWVTSHPAEAGVLAEKLEFGISALDGESAIPRCNLVFIEASASRRILEEFLGVFLEFAPEAIGGKLPDDGFYGEK
jgi:NitT/TauT family transport system substrate-binding protein